MVGISAIWEVRSRSNSRMPRHSGLPAPWVNDGLHVGHSSKAHASKKAAKLKKTSSRAAISSSSPLGMMALHLLAQWRKSGRNGVVCLAENENRAERLGAVVHALDPSCDVLVLPRLNTLPFDQLEPAHEIAGRRSSVLRRLAKPKKPILL